MTELALGFDPARRRALQGEYDQGNPSYDDIGDGVTYGYGDEYDDKTDDIDSIITAGIDLMDEDEAIVADRNC